MARRKLSLLELAEELGNVSKPCRIAGYSRLTQHEIFRLRRRSVLFGLARLRFLVPFRIFLALGLMVY